MKLVGWTSLWVVLMAGAAIAQIDMAEQEAVEAESTLEREVVEVGQRRSQPDRGPGAGHLQRQGAQGPGGRKL